MKILAYLCIITGFVWGGIVARERPVAEAGTPIAVLLGIGFALLTAHSVRIGSIRGANGRIERAESPKTFWVAVAISGAAAGAMLIGAFWLAP